MTDTAIAMIAEIIEMTAMMTIGEIIENMMIGATEAMTTDMIGIAPIGENIQMIGTITTKTGGKSIGYHMIEINIKETINMIATTEKTDFTKRADIRMIKEATKMIETATQEMIAIKKRTSIRKKNDILKMIDTIRSTKGTKMIGTPIRKVIAEKDSVFLVILKMIIRNPNVIVMKRGNSSQAAKEDSIQAVREDNTQADRESTMNLEMEKTMEITKNLMEKTIKVT